MKKNYSGSLKKYSLITGSLVLAGTKVANAQIQFIDIVPDSIISGGDSWTIDFNNDLTNDISIEQKSSFYTYTIASTLNSTQIIDGGYSTPAALDAGTIIDSTSAWESTSGYGFYGLLASSWGSPQFGGAGDKYLGFRFQISGEYHYGWMLLNADAAGDTVIVKSYAYNTTPNEIILAGALLTNIESNEAVSISVSPNPTVGLVKIQGEGIKSVKIYDSLGNLLITSGNGDADLGGQPSGIYFALVETDKGTVSKRIVKE